MPKANSLLDDMHASLCHRRGPLPWYETLPADLRREAEQIKYQWKSGVLKATKRSLSLVMSKSLKARGVTIGYWGVQRWLEAD